MDNKMFILQGNETPEQLMIYLKNYDDKIYNSVSLTPLKKLAFLKRIVDKDAQTIVSNVEANFEGYTEVEDVDGIHHHHIEVMIQTIKLPVTQTTKLPVTQLQSDSTMAAAALTTPLKSYTHRISAIVNRLNTKIHLQTRQLKYTHMI